MVRWMAFNSCPGYQLNRRWKNDKIDVLEGKTFYAINTKTCGTQKRIDDKTLAKKLEKYSFCASPACKLFAWGGHQKP